MPKMKTNRAAAKRFRKTARGKIRCSRPCHNHILTKKTTKRKRKLRQDVEVDKSNVGEIRRLLPYL